MNEGQALTDPLIHRFDYLAHKTHAIIIPSCGFDSLPSDISAFLAAKTLKAALGPGASLGASRTAVRLRGGVSGGTLQTAITLLEEIPKDRLAFSRLAYSISPSACISLSRGPSSETRPKVKGAPVSGPKLLYTLPIVTPRTYGGFWLMGPHNTAIVQRTWGLLQANASAQPEHAYGPQFTYEEFLATSGPLHAVLLSLGLALGGLCLAFISPVRIARSYMRLS